MNETSRMIFAAAHTGDTMIDLNNHLSEMFLMMFGVIILLLSGWRLIDTILNAGFTFFKRNDDKKG